MLYQYKYIGPIFCRDFNRKTLLYYPNKFKCKLSHIKLASASEKQTHFIEQNILCKDCVQCNYSFTENTPAEELCKKHDLVIDFYRCPECIFSGKNETGFQIHMAAKHKESVNSNSG